LCTGFLTKAGEYREHGLIRIVSVPAAGIRQEVDGSTSQRDAGRTKTWATGGALFRRKQGPKDRHPEQSDQSRPIPENLSFEH
jgi:hypothetical protein